MFGGYNGSAPATDYRTTYEFDGIDWTQVGTGGPGKITEGYMAYLPTTGTTVHFGGSGPALVGTVNNETWTYSGATSAGVPTLAATSLPVLGTNYQLTCNGAPAVSIGIVVHGLDNLELSPGIYLPFDLGLVGIAGCGLEVRADATVVELPVAGTFTHTFPVPNNLGLLGIGLFSQVLLLDNLAPNGFAGMTNAVHAVLGT